MPDDVDSGVQKPLNAGDRCRRVEENERDHDESGQSGAREEEAGATGPEHCDFDCESRVAGDDDGSGAGAAGVAEDVEGGPGHCGENGNGDHGDPSPWPRAQSPGSDGEPGEGCDLESEP